MPKPRSCWSSGAAETCCALLTAALCAACPAPHEPASGAALKVGPQERVEIAGYDGVAMEPFVTRDGRYLLFNDSNAPLTDTNLHYAERRDELHFDYRGEIRGPNSSELDAVASTDRAGNFYFVSMRDYVGTLSSLYRGHFSNGAVGAIEVVPGVSRETFGFINFDAEISWDGDSLVFVDGLYAIPVPVPVSADLVLARRTGSGFERSAEGQTWFASLNTPALEYAPCLSRDGRELWFTRIDPARVPPDPQILYSVRADANSPFPPPTALDLDGFVEAPALSPDERSIYFHRREDDDRFVIYRVRR